MRIAAVSMIRNESDIIELFVRINARIFDRFFIVDNGSCDSTLDILDKLISEGFPITLSSDKTLGHPQDKLITNLIQHAASTEPFDWLFPIDADEFVLGEKHSLCSSLAILKPGTCAHMRWKTFVPIAANYFDVENPLWTNFRARCRETTDYYKVVVPSTLANLGRVTMGNHDWRSDDDKRIPTSIIDIPLAHIPVRSSDQLICKALIGSHQLSIKQNRKRTEGFHWDALAQYIREHEYSVTTKQLTTMALSYGTSEFATVECELEEDLRIGTNADKIHYAELARINSLQRLDNFISEACSEINALRQPRGWLSRLLRRN